jgi:hypothetical protein
LKGFFMGIAFTLIQSTHIFPNTPPEGWEDVDLYVINPTISESNFEATLPPRNSLAPVIGHVACSYVLSAGGAGSLYDEIRLAIQSEIGESAYWHDLTIAPFTPHIDNRIKEGVNYLTRPSAALGTVIANAIIDNIPSWINGVFCDNMTADIPNHYWNFWLGETEIALVNGDRAAYEILWDDMNAAMRLTLKAAWEDSKALVCNSAGATYENADGITIESGHFPISPGDGASAVLTNSSANTTVYTKTFATVLNQFVSVYVNVTNIGSGTLTDNQGLNFGPPLRSVTYGNNKLYCFVATNVANGLNTTVTFTCSGATGCTIDVRKTNSYPGLASAALVRQVAYTTGLGGTAPSVSMPFPFKTYGGSGVIGNTSTIDDLAKPTNWDLKYRVTRTDPVVATAGIRRISGETAQTISWQSVSSTPWGAIILEIISPSEARGLKAFTDQAIAWANSPDRYGDHVLSATWNYDSATFPTQDSLFFKGNYV